MRGVGCVGGRHDWRPVYGPDNLRRVGWECARCKRTRDAAGEEPRTAVVAGGVYCAECKRDSQPGSAFCGTCGRPLHRFKGPRGVEWGYDDPQPKKQQHRWPLVIVLGVIGALIVVGSVDAITKTTNHSTAFPAVTFAPPVITPATIPPSSTPPHVVTANGVGGWSLSIHGVHDPYTPLETFLDPTPGTHDIAVDVEMRNVSGKVQTFPLPFGFTIQDAAGHSYPVSLFGSMHSPTGGTDPGADLRGLVLFQNIRDGSKGLSVVFWPDPLESPAKFAIG